MSPLRLVATATALSAALAVPSGAVEVFFNFDSVPSGSPARSVAPAGITFEPALYAPDLDDGGSPIPGTESWRVDGSAAEVTVDNPFNLGRGAAPSPANALNALFQPVLVQFANPELIRRFSITLDYDVFGDRSQTISFFDSGNQLLASFPIDQRQPGFTLNQTLELNGVSAVVLPAGALYDNLGISSVPEPGVLPLSALGAWATWLVTRRRHATA